MEEEMDETPRVTTLYIRIGNSFLRAERRKPVRREPLPEGWDGRVIPIRPDVAMGREPPFSGGFLRGAQLLEACLRWSGSCEIKLRLANNISTTNDAIVAAARDGRVIWTDGNGFVWIHRVLGVTVRESGGFIVSLRLAARRAVDISRWTDDPSLELGSGKKIPLPSSGHLIVVSATGDTVSTEPFLIPSSSRVS